LREASDDELIAGCLRGDAVSWSAFVERFAGLVHWSIRRSAPEGSDDFRREVFQQFFERLIDRNELAKLREVSHVRKFLSVMACHLALDRLKAKRRESKRLSPLDEAMTEAQPGPLGEEFPEEAAAALRALLSELGPKERACLEFYFVDGRTAAETGRLLGLSEESVRGVLKRAKERLRSKLGEQGFQ
jgi:RNA polymerase sigma factor (sigma-70 family)